MGGSAALDGPGILGARRCSGLGCDGSERQVSLHPCRCEGPGLKSQIS